MKRSILLEIVSFLFVVLFVYAATAKLLDYQKFVIQVGQSPLLIPFAGWVAWFIPTVEILIAILVATPKLRTIGLYASFTLMAMFTAYIIAILNTKGYVPCSCGGILEKLGWTEHLIFNIIFVILSLIGIFLAPTKCSKEQSVSTDRVAV